MKQSAMEIQELRKKYPFVSEILNRNMKPHAPGSDSRAKNAFDHLTIRVQKADGDLMFRQAKNVGLGGEETFATRDNDAERADQVMRCGEYLFAIDSKGKIINRVNWPKNREERVAARAPVYGNSALWTINSSGHRYKTPIWDKVDALVWITVETWHTDTQNVDAYDGRFGEFRDRSIDITIYEKPDQGFETLYHESNVFDNLFLDSFTLALCSLENNHEIITICGMLREMAYTFRDEVYLNGMRTLLDRSKLARMTGDFGTTKVRCVVKCFAQQKNDVFLLEDAVSHIEFSFYRSSNYVLPIGTLHGTLPQIRNLVRTVVRMWREQPELRDAFKPDKDISVM